MNNCYPGMPFLKGYQYPGVRPGGYQGCLRGPVVLPDSGQ